MSAKRVGRGQRRPSPHDEPTEFRRTFARNLRQAREAAGLSPHALAKAAPYNSDQLADLEANATNVTLDTVERLAKALGLTEIDLLRPDMENVTVKRVDRAPGEPPPKTELTAFRRGFAENLRQARLAAGLAQRELSRAAGLALTRVWTIEVHTANVTLDTVTLLANSLGCNEIDLLRPKDR
jgi:transcriptional regulator with XRE-family HTH domain